MIYQIIKIRTYINIMLVIQQSFATIFLMFKTPSVQAGFFFFVIIVFSV